MSTRMLSNSGLFFGVEANIEGQLCGVLRRYAGWSPDRFADAFEAWFTPGSHMEDAEPATGMARSLAEGLNAMDAEFRAGHDIDTAPLPSCWWFLTLCNAVDVLPPGCWPSLTKLEAMAAAAAAAVIEPLRLRGDVVAAGPVASVSVPARWRLDLYDDPDSPQACWWRTVRRQRPGVPDELTEEAVRDPAGFVSDWLGWLRATGGRERYSAAFVESACLAYAWVGRPLSRDEAIRFT